MGGFGEDLWVDWGLAVLFVGVCLNLGRLGLYLFDDDMDLIGDNGSISPPVVLYS